MTRISGGELFQKFEKASRAENIYEVIKEGILQGVWKPGDKINDLELSKQLGVSRISVREALSKFVENRIIEKRHWKGYQVRCMSWDEIRGILEIRMSLEMLAIGHVARVVTPELLRELEQAIERSVRDMEADDHDAFRKSDFLFHEILYRESGNPWISRVLESLRILIEIIRHMSQVDRFREVARESIGEHREVIRCLAARDGAGAVESLRRHIAGHSERVRVEVHAYGGQCAETGDSGSAGEGDAVESDVDRSGRGPAITPALFDAAIRRSRPRESR